jgi:Membrane protein involved in the export of O-antigen and teichoic acid
MILTVAAVFSRLLGILFIIPFYWLTGEEGTYLYANAYTLYVIMLSISTLGLPLAVSKFISKYNTLGDYESGKRLLRSGTVVMIITGLTGFLILFFGAPSLTALYGIPAENYDNVVLMTRVVSIAITVVPLLSLLRGYFQGFQSMGPTAVSQVAEQVMRVAFILVSSFIVMKVLNGSVVTAAALATFAAFIGAVSGLYVMLHFWALRHEKIAEMIKKATKPRRYRMSFLSMYKELLTYAVPFVAVGIAMQAYELIDQMMASHYLPYSYQDKIAIIGDLTMNDQKLVLIPVTLATSLAVSAVPAIIASFAKNDQNAVHEKITQAFELVLFLTVPAAVGLSMLGYMVHGTLYNTQPDLLAIGGRILRWYAPTALLFALFQVGASILQGINRQIVTLVALFTGIMLKILLNPISMKLFGMVGPVIATDIGYTASIITIFIAIRKATNYRFSLLGQQVVHICAYTAIMALTIKVIFMLTGGYFPHSRISALFITLLAVLVGAAVYLALAKWTGLLRRISGGTHLTARKRS